MKATKRFVLNSSRFQGERPFVNECGKDFAKRLCDAACGVGNHA